MRSVSCFLWFVVMHHIPLKPVTCILPLNLNCGADSWRGFILVVTSQIGEENGTREKKSDCFNECQIPPSEPQTLNLPIY